MSTLDELQKIKGHGSELVSVYIASTDSVAYVAS
jgi:hypothetical protein